MASRDAHGLLKGDLHYNVGFPVTILSHITPLLHGCTECEAITLHVVGEQPTGPGIKVPFMRKPLATLSKSYTLICNNCTQIAGAVPKDVVAKLENRIMPTELCEPLDAFFGTIPDAPPTYTKEFPRFYLSINPDEDEETKSYFLWILSLYKRE